MDDGQQHGVTRRLASLAEVVEIVDGLYPPETAQAWDAVGLVAGEPDRPVGRVLLAVDPVASVVDEALAWGADLLVTHHPLFLAPVHSVAATSAKGRVLHRLVEGHVALLVAHTNADVAHGGVSDALADLLGVQRSRPLEPSRLTGVDKLVVFVPVEHAEPLIDALAASGAGRLGAYDRCAWTVDGHGTFRPLAGARPAIGQLGASAWVRETRVEMLVPSGRQAAVVAALRACHPYEEPAFDLIPLTGLPERVGMGRIGRLERPESLIDFAQRVARQLPPTPVGVRFAGDPGRPVRTVAVCGGAGDALLAAATRAGADVYLTADLRHHRASEHREGIGEVPALVDVAHWASEWPWLEVAASRLGGALTERGATVVTRVSTISTDPWTAHLDVPSV